MNTATATTDRWRLKAMSPDKTVKATWAPGEEPHVAVRPGSMNKHTESSLAQQIQYALAGMRSGYDAAKQKVADEFTKKASSSTRQRLADKKLLARSKRAAGLLSAIDVRGTSRGKLVEIRLHDDEFKVTIAPATIGRHRSDAIMSEVNSATRDVFARFSREATAVFESVYR